MHTNFAKSCTTFDLTQFYYESLTAASSPSNLLKICMSGQSDFHGIWFDKKCVCLICDAVCTFTFQLCKMQRDIFGKKTLSHHHSWKKLLFLLCECNDIVWRNLQQIFCIKISNQKERFLFTLREYINLNEQFKYI